MSEQAVAPLIEVLFCDANRDPVATRLMPVVPRLGEHVFLPGEVVRRWRVIDVTYRSIEPGEMSYHVCLVPDP